MQQARKLETVSLISEPILLVYFLLLLLLLLLPLLLLLLFTLTVREIPNIVLFHGFIIGFRSDWIHACRAQVSRLLLEFVQNFTKMKISKRWLQGSWFAWHIWLYVIKGCHKKPECTTDERFRPDAWPIFVFCVSSLMRKIERELFDV